MRFRRTTHAWATGNTAAALLVQAEPGTIATIMLLNHRDSYELVAADVRHHTDDDGRTTIWVGDRLAAVSDRHGIVGVPALYAARLGAPAPTALVA